MNRIRVPASGRPAFTLVELLVVIGNYRRADWTHFACRPESARGCVQAQCQNNLKQFGLAFHNHHDALGCFPSRRLGLEPAPTYIGGQPAVGPLQRAGWGFQILPYIEGGKRLGVRAPSPPSRRRTSFSSARRAGPADGDPSRQLFPAAHRRRHRPCARAITPAATKRAPGSIRRFLRNRMLDIADGTSLTLMIAEKRINLRYLGEWQDDDNEGYTAGWNDDTLRRTTRVPAARTTRWHSATDFISSAPRTRAG